MAVIFSHRGEGTRQRAAGRMDDRSGKPPVPVASDVQLSVLKSSLERLYSGRGGPDDHVEQQTVVDDDQVVWSAVDRVGVFSDTSPGGFLVGA